MTWMGLAQWIGTLLLLAVLWRQQRRHAADLHRVRVMAFKARIALIKAECERDEAQRETQLAREELDRAAVRLGEVLRLLTPLSDDVRRAA